MDSISNKIEKYQNGDEKSLEELLIMMTPLVKKYAGKTYCMEKEDAMQEYYIILIKCMQKMKYGKTDPEYLCYMERAVSSHYIRLNTKYLNKQREICIDEIDQAISDQREENNFLNMEFRCDLERLRIENYRQWTIIILYVQKNMTCADIGHILGVSRQYVCREKNKFLEKIRGGGYWRYKVKILREPGSVFYINNFR